MLFVDLPHDILFDILARLSVPDVLALRQTCRVLNVLGAANYLWHSLTESSPLPLDLPLGVPKITLSSEELQRIAISALRLEVSWRRPTPRLRPRAIVSDSDEPYSDELQLLPGGKWLLVAQRRSRRWEDRRLSGSVTLWTLHDLDAPRPITRVEFSGIYRSMSMYVQSGGTSANLVVGVHSEASAKQNGGAFSYIQIHTLSLEHQTELPYMRTALTSAPQRIDLPLHPRATHIPPMIHVVATSGTAIAVTAVFLQGGIADENPLQILLADTSSRCMRYIDPCYVRRFSSLTIRIYEDTILLLGKVVADLVLRTYRLPELTTSCKTSEFLKLGDLLTEYTVPLAPALRRISDIACVSPAAHGHLTVLIFDPTLGHPGTTQLVRFPPTGPAHSATFETPPDVSAQLVQVGPTGRRAVWLEHNWDLQQKRVMRCQLVDEKPVVDVLLPPEPQLPFLTNTTHSLAFDDVTGRVCLGLYNGHIYALDFV